MSGPLTATPNDRTGFYPMPSRLGEKACSRCGETKPLTEFFWNRHYGRWSSWCHYCGNRNQGHTCFDCGAAVTDTAALNARREGRPVRCLKHGAIESGLRRRREIPHGTETMYTHHGCRCDECRAAAAAARRARRHVPEEKP